MTTAPPTAPQAWWPSPYGPDDQAGALNEITPAGRVRAARLVREGRVYDLAHVLDEHVPAFRSLLDAMRCRDEVIDRSSYLGGKLGISAVAHQNGTARFGTDPATSVLDVNCKVHDLDNVYLVDSSFFVSSSSVNATLTIIANALRVADHLRARLG